MLPPFLLSVLLLNAPACKFLGRERMRMQVEFEREEDGRWIAEIPAIPGALCYAPSQKEAAVKVVALALRILADRFEHGEDVPAPFDELFCVPA
jgi:predicted RNase H-like HicB family nuclease